VKILVVNPNTSRSMTDTIDAAARGAASVGTQILTVQPFSGPEAIDCAMEGYLSAVAVMDRITAVREPYDAVVLAGFGEPGREGIQ
jgi:allantoin racemase